MFGQKLLQSWSRWPILEVKVRANSVNDAKILQYGPEHEYKMEYPKHEYLDLDQDDPILEVKVGANAINDDNILQCGPELEYKMEYPRFSMIFGQKLHQSWSRWPCPWSQDLSLCY